MPSGLSEGIGDEGPFDCGPSFDWTFDLEAGPWEELAAAFDLVEFDLPL